MFVNWKRSYLVIKYEFLDYLSSYSLFVWNIYWFEQKYFQKAQFLESYQTIKRPGSCSIHDPSEIKKKIQFQIRLRAKWGPGGEATTHFNKYEVTLLQSFQIFFLVRYFIIIQQKEWHLEKYKWSDTPM